MEAGVALEMVTNMYNDSDNRLYIEFLVSDNDSNMRSHLRHIETVVNYQQMCRSQPSLRIQVTGLRLYVVLSTK